MTGELEEWYYGIIGNKEMFIPASKGKALGCLLASSNPADHDYLLRAARAQCHPLGTIKSWLADNGFHFAEWPKLSPVQGSGVVVPWSAREATLLKMRWS